MPDMNSGVQVLGTTVRVLGSPRPPGSCCPPSPAVPVSFHLASLCGWVVLTEPGGLFCLLPFPILTECFLIRRQLALPVVRSVSPVRGSLQDSRDLTSSSAVPRSSHACAHACETRVFQDRLLTSGQTRTQRPPPAPAAESS